MTTWVGAGVTHTKRSSTLFTVLPPSFPIAATEALFSPLPGFLTSRRVQREATGSTLLFLDFATDADATAAMRLNNGKLPQAGLEGGLSLDFDKDNVEKRKRAVERAKTKEEVVWCVVCHAPQLWLAPLTRLDALPRRTTDGATAVEEAPLLRQCAAAEGAAVFIPRERGLERQVPLSCGTCGVRWGYRSAPLGQPSRCTYVHVNGLTHSLRGGEAAAALREEARAALGGGSKRPRPAEEGGGRAGERGGGGRAGERGGGAGEPEGGEEEEEEEEGGAEGRSGGALAAPTTFSSAHLAARFAKVLKRRGLGEG